MSRRFFTLSAVTRRLEELLRPALGRTFWVKAEIHSGRERGGAFYCDLVEVDAAGGIVAQMRCSLWSAELARIRRRFRDAGLDLALDDGTSVGIECRLAFHPRYGLSLQGVDMDPAVALGELELRRRRILESLERDGLLERNRALAVPLLPSRIALVTSRGSAACLDFVRTLHASAFGFRIYLADVNVQGPEAEAQILAALDAVERLPVDVVAIVRGGGSRTDLAALDSEPIARRIGSLRLPVFTGIGHETDQSILDCVAAAAFKTPTAVGEELVARFTSMAIHLGEARKRLRSGFGRRRESDRATLGRAMTGLRQGTRKLLDVRRASLLGDAQRLRAAVASQLAAQKARLEGARRDETTAPVRRLREARRAVAESRARLARSATVRLDRVLRDAAQRRARLRPRLALRRIEAERAGLVQRRSVLRALDPEAALARGYSLTTDADGRLVRSAHAVAVGGRLVTRLADGRLTSTIAAIEEDRDGGDV